MISFDFLAVLAEWPLLLKGLAWTLGLTLLSMPLGLVIATLIYLALSVALRRLLDWAGPKFFFGR